MVNLRAKVVFVSSILATLVGCSSNPLDDRYVGTTYYFSKASNQLAYSPDYHHPDPSRCIEENEEFKIILNSAVFWGGADGPKENFSEGETKKTSDNELGYFISVSGGKNTPSIQDYLVYTTYGRKKGEPANFINLPVYTGKNDGNESIVFEVKVHEFDKKNGQEAFKKLSTLSRSLVKLSGTSLQNPEVTELVNDIGNMTVNSMFKDDIVTSFKMTFTPCGLYADNAKSIYLQSGDILFMRSANSGSTYITPFYHRRQLQIMKGELSDNDIREAIHCMDTGGELIGKVKSINYSQISFSIQQVKKQPSTDVNPDGEAIELLTKVDNQIKSDISLLRSDLEASQLAISNLEIGQPKTDTAQTSKVCKFKDNKKQE
ncbi:hypothetical protein TW84_17100 [Vibrio neptunius]|uniref:hypothetical protein n=1 Tax=Vibrio neptunius TaxID=170651 RepID=UPI0005F9DB34|nr:hypothetical protein [Vibrio neptunius]KJY87590.1 hypothetical protein TW84_17100 [Vibrio neptunius]